MGRPPCCENVGIKKGPWTPEEDIILVSYIQEHGPGNWRSVPTNTGLLRCSKSCRLRWTNYLRPGIKRGKFTPHEEGMIIHLQALLGNKWASIASYLPQRTDNDIKNYWNTHLKKKLKKLQSAAVPNLDDPHHSLHQYPKNIFTSTNKNMDITTSSTVVLGHNNVVNKPTNATSTSNTVTYASSTENISRLLEGWMRSSPNITTTTTTMKKKSRNIDHANDLIKDECKEGHGGGSMSNEEFESILSLHNLNNNGRNYKYSNSSHHNQLGISNEDHEMKVLNDDDDDDDYDVDDAVEDDRRQKSSNHDHDNNSYNLPPPPPPPPLSFLEKWLLDETSATCQVDEMMQELPPIFR